MERTWQPEDKWLTVNDLRLHYLDWGNSSAASMVLLHHHTGNAHYWDFFAKGMRHNYHAIALDQRGHGDSSWVGGYNPKEYVADLNKFVDKLRLNDIVLIGHSLGGINAIAYAATHPGRVAQLVIVDIGPEINDAGIEKIKRHMAEQPEAFHSEEEATRHMKQNHPYYPEEFIRHLVKHYLKRDRTGRLIFKYDPALHQVEMGSVAWLWPYLEEIVCPTLIVHGVESDLLLSDAARKMVDRLAFGSLVEIERAGHSVPGDNPEAFEAAVRRFLSSYSRRPK